MSDIGSRYLTQLSLLLTQLFTIIITDNTYTDPLMKRYTLQTSTTITIPVGTTAIAANYYAGCPMISITIPNTVTRIGNHYY
jgi:hypothetical protein